MAVLYKKNPKTHKPKSQKAERLIHHTQGRLTTIRHFIWKKKIKPITQMVMADFMNDIKGKSHKIHKTQ